MYKSLGFQEKSAWVMICALWVSGFMYFSPMIAAFLESGAIASPGRAAIKYVVIIVTIAIIGHIIAAISDPDSANAALDERDRLISHRSGHWSGIVFGVLVVTSLLAYLVIRVEDLLFHTIFASLIVSQIVEYALIIFAYRRGS